MVSSRDVAKLANVSVSTVSRAFRDDCYIDEQTRKKVHDAANKLGYVPNLIARSLKKRQSKMIGIIVPDSENIFFSNVVRTIETNLKMKGYTLLITYNNEGPEEEKQNLQMFLSSQVDGIIFTPVSVNNEAIINLIKKNIPLVQLYRGAYKQIASIIADDLEEAAMATSHLVDNGHRKILMITTKKELAAVDSKQERSKGFIRIMHKNGIAISENNLLLLEEKEDNPFDKIKERLLEMQPTAVIAGTNLIAQDVIKVCKSLKLSIPEDLSFIMFDDVSWADLMDITTVSQPIEETGLTAFRILMDALQRTSPQKSASSTILQPILTQRNSVKRIE